MQNDDILSIAEQVAKQSSEQRERQEVEAYIQDVCSTTRLQLSNTLWYQAEKATDPRIVNWVKSRRNSLTLDFCQALAILLRRELLPEEAKEEE